MKNDFATPEEIKYAESILLSQGNSFEEDKVNIIKCNESKSIKACPGSGKTTTLLAKLAIIANRMPLENNQGICVLTHTNVAIEEIKSKLGHKSDILFSYPNHFGTIQSFVDKYLAIPALKKYYQCNVDRIDDDLANERLSKSFKALVPPYPNKLHSYLFGIIWPTESKITKTELTEIFDLEKNLLKIKIQELEAKRILERKKRTYFFIWENFNKKKLSELLEEDKEILKKMLKKRQSIIDELEYVKEEIILNLILDFNNQRIIRDSRKFASFESESGNQFLKLKEELFEKGILSFQDAYDLSNRYLNDYSNIAEAFRNRFKYVFIDEMQDTYKHQLDIIERIFGERKTVIQYFGDPRQAIYNSVKSGEDWNPKKFLPINASKRFGENIARILRTVRIDPSEELKENEEINSLKPHLLVYENPENVLPKFCEIIASENIDTADGRKTAWELSCEEKRPIKAIGWVGEPNKETRSADHLTIQSYFSAFRKNIKKKDKVDYDSIKTFLKKHDKATIKDYSDNIIRALTHILILEKRKPRTGGETHRYTKSSLLRDLKESKPIAYSVLLKNLAIWSQTIHLSDRFDSDVYDSVVDFIEGRFFKCFKIDKPNSLTKNFLVNDPKERISNEEIKANNTYSWSGNNEVKIELGTIHSAKGETHIATLLLETSYYGNHESETIMNQLLGVPYTATENNGKIIETLKMAYVAMSRPKYLLCMAIKKERIQTILDDVEKREKLDSLWKVVEI